MTDRSKLTAFHLQRQALVYVRQSSSAQVENNPESTARQYALTARAAELGWTAERTVVIDDDLGISGAGTAVRAGFARLIAEVALGRVGIVLGLEASRLARNNADWYRLLDLCSVSDTLIADADGLYHPADFNDRLVLGLKGTMSEAELHVLRARLDGGIRNKARRGELRRGLPVGLVWGEGEGEIRFDPDEAVGGAVRTVFERFAALGSVRQVWLWFRAEGLSFPSRHFPGDAPRWITPTYTQVHQVLTNPAYAGAYAYGKTRRERYVDPSGALRRRLRSLPRDQWSVLIPEHHPGFIDWETYLDNQARIGGNIHPRPHAAGGAVREGAALLQGIAACGRCGRRLLVAYTGRGSSPTYYCRAGGGILDGRGTRCLSVGGRQIERAITQAFLAALTPAGMEATILAAEQLEGDFDAALGSWRLAAERARYEASRAERHYHAVDPDNRLVARSLEAAWEAALADLAKAEAEMAERERRRPRRLSDPEREALAALGDDLGRVWDAPSTSDRERKELLHTLVEEVLITPAADKKMAHLVMRWRGGATTELECDLVHPRQPPNKTAEATIDLLRRLAVHYSDAQIAGILNRQGRRSASGERFTAVIVGGLRRYRGIATHTADPDVEPQGELATVQKAAKILGIAPSTVHRWLNDGFVAGEQLTPGAPWRIRLNSDLRAKFAEEAPPGWVPMLEATHALRVSRQTVLHRIQRGELRAMHVRSGRRRGLRIELPQPAESLMSSLFEGSHELGG